MVAERRARAAAVGGTLGAALGVAASAGCDVASGGVCAPANPSMVAAMTAAGAATGLAVDTLVHGNSASSMRGTELYYLINRDSGEIDKIGITSNPGSRYSQSYLNVENVTYVPQAQYTWRYPAMVDENIRLNFYRFEHGQLPRLNKVDR
jgi:hypothetical protein